MPSGGSLATAYVQILPTTEGIKGNLEKELGSAGEAAGDSAGKKAGGKFSSAMGAVMKATGAALAAAGAAATAVVTGAVKNFAEYEQLAGGAELMWGEAYDFIAEKAENAFSSVQMSTNDYLESANYYATGLKTALGGDAQAAAELADGIITAQADIVAATGGSAEAVSNAFEGVMRGNYTMLDNLGLGITGTKEGMQAVIDSVNEWREAQGEAGDLVIDSMADCEQALIDYVEMQGMAGYASAEGLSTIEGSLSSMSAAWENTLVAMANENGNLEGSIDGLVASVTAFAENIAPRIETALGGVGQLIANLAPVIVGMLPGLVSSVLPGLLDAATQIVISLAGALPGIITVLGQSVIDAVDMIIPMIPQVIPSLLQGIFDMITQLSTRLLEQLPTILTELVTNVAAMLPGIISGAFDFATTMVNIVLGAIPAIIEVVPEIVQGVIDALIENFPLITQGIISLVEAVTANIGPIMDAVVEMLPILIDAVASGIIEFLPLFIECGIQLFTALLEDIPTIVSTILLALPEIIGSLITGILAFLGDLAETGAELIDSLIEGMEGQSLGEWFSNLWSDIVAGISEFGSEFWENIKSDLIDPVVEGFENFIEKIEDIFDINLEFPDIKLPHFSASGKFSLNPLEVPKISIDWYAKAMDEGMILDAPTIFGAAGNSLLAGGEVGPEAVVGVHSLRSMIEDAASGGTDEGIDQLVLLVGALSNKLDRMGIYLDGGALVGGLVDDIDSALGVKSAALSRGY